MNMLFSVQNLQLHLEFLESNQTEALSACKFTAVKKLYIAYCMVARILHVRNTQRFTHMQLTVMQKTMVSPGRPHGTWLHGLEFA